VTRLLVTLRFDGTNYHGWQVQANAVTVQQTVQDALQSLTGTRPGVTGCSRTDAGVHAAMYCCAVDTAFPLRGGRFCAALNAHLPDDIAAYDCVEVAPDFHPRYGAAAKRYTYTVWNAPARNPFWERYAWHVAHPLPVVDPAPFVGTHDFKAFQAAGTTVADTVRTVTHAAVTREAAGGGELWRFSVEANGFLYNMVRIMAGTLAEGRDIAAALEGKDRALAGITAPARGLCLTEVRY